MKMREQQILMDRRFRIFRLNLNRLKISEASMAGGWKVYSNFSTKVECQETWKILMQDKNNLEG